MKREDKATAVAELAEHLGAASAVFAVEYRGISVPQAAELRAKLRESNASFKVVKNRLAKLAAEQSGTEGLDDLLRGPIALTLIKGDPVTAAKTIATFSKENDVLSYRGGIMDGGALEPDAFLAIARLPGVDVLHGQLVGIIASPLTGLVAGLGNLISGLGRQLAQIAEQGLVTGEAPEPAPPVEEPAPEQPPVEEPPGEDEPEPAAEPATDPESDAEAQDAEPAAEAAPQEADADVNEEESSEESEPAGEDSEEPDSDDTPEED